VKYILTINGNVLPYNTKLVDHKPHHTPRSNTMIEPKMAVWHQFTDSGANTSCRKLQAFPLKKYRYRVADPCHISNGNRLIFRHVY